MNPLLTTGLDAHRGATALSVNVNKVALLRNTRHLGIPSVVHAATLALQAGAHGITVHPRPDARHIRPDDVHELAALLKQWPQAEYNIEGNPFHNLMPFVRETRPQQCTFVPDGEGQLTSDHSMSRSSAVSLSTTHHPPRQALSLPVTECQGLSARRVGSSASCRPDLPAEIVSTPSPARRYLRRLPAPGRSNHAKA